ncbi:alpha-ribazole phosphatase [Serpentinicella alkaliphila]|uniref:Alpha-ribazole phosphatase n=1 Tax=Serpentinicella alkaliphila TaxID=1734049 RepID=A0A4R2TNK2_9FIRM|nr:alpha-ribazole phosphatase [Serpentinicella alkaliphila]QUH24434.1 alpha-ribazole phosphatase [Serpentinicella alkaliphila]TCQ04172.1 alpha-ribazole phosphatase [Serpentinicella alkaliphila]
MTTYLYLVRHGETILNESKVYYGSTDCPLNSRGIIQAEELGKTFKNNFDVVISSPLSRAIDTAKLLSGLNTRDMVIDEGLKEINFGLWEGLHYKDISIKFENEWNEWINDWKNVAPPMGESFLNQYNRVSNSLNHIIERFKDKRVVIVSHQGCLRIIASILLKMEDRGFWSFTFDPGTYSLFEISDTNVTIRKINSKG